MFAKFETNLFPAGATAQPFKAFLDQLGMIVCFAKVGEYHALEFVVMNGFQEFACFFVR